MLRGVRERSRLSSPSQLWIAGLLYPYNVIIYLFCIELLLYSKDVTFDLVP
jgi:NADH:ubiquinone oxidoreductase subunit K